MSRHLALTAGAAQKKIKPGVAKLLLLEGHKDSSEDVVLETAPPPHRPTEISPSPGAAGP